MDADYKVHSKVNSIHLPQDHSNELFEHRHAKKFTSVQEGQTKTGKCFC